MFFSDQITKQTLLARCFREIFGKHHHTFLISKYHKIQRENPIWSQYRMTKISKPVYSSFEYASIIVSYEFRQKKNR